MSQRIRGTVVTTMLAVQIDVYFTLYLPAIHPVSRVLDGHLRHVFSPNAAEVDDERVAVHLNVFVTKAMTSYQ